MIPMHCHMMLYDSNALSHAVI